MYGRISFLRNTKHTGDISELRVMAAFAGAGYKLSIPFGEANRYDLIADDGERLWRVQIKTGRIRKGAIVFNCYSSHAHRGGAARLYSGQVDLFAVYCPDDDGVYALPIDDVSTVRGCLRVEPAANNQQRKVRWAAPYRVGQRATSAVGAEAVDAVPFDLTKLPL